MLLMIENVILALNVVIVNKIWTENYTKQLSDLTLTANFTG